MILAGAAALMLFAFGGGEDDKQPRPRPPVGATMTVRQQIIIRVPAGIRSIAPAGGSLIDWRESRGPRCVPASRIVGATFPRPNSVDFIFRDNSRIRARLERRCPALEFYRNFYVNATTDGLICADRDAIRSRIGGECQIDQFRTLRASRP